MVRKHVRRLHVKFKLDPTVELRIMTIVVKLDIAHFTSEFESDCFFVTRIISYYLGKYLPTNEEVS
jgi:hypothetical protein